MTPSRVVRVFVAFLLLSAVPSFAFAATTEFRVLFDVDNDDTTGCTVNGMDGVDQVLVTQVTEGDAASTRVTRTHRQSCLGSVLGSPVDIDTTGWSAGWNNSNKLLTLETRIPFSAFGSAEMPANIHAGFDGSRNGSLHTSLANQDGTPILIPQPPTRRRAIGTGADRHIAMDGDLADWGDVKPAVIGLASNGTPMLRLLRILAWPDPNDHHLYFAATAYLGGDFPYADDDMYPRLPDQSLSVNVPGVLGNDKRNDGLAGSLTAEKVSDPKRGTVTLNPDGSFTYSPTHPQLIDSDEFEYKAVGAGKESNVARVIIRVDQSEGPCSGNVACDDEYEAFEDTTLVKPAPGVLGNDKPSANVYDAEIVTNPQHGTVVLNDDGGFTYTPEGDYSGPDSFVYEAVKKAGQPVGIIGGPATVRINVQAVNDAPFIVAETFSLPENSPAGTLVGTVNAGDVEGDPLAFSIVGGNTSGAFAIHPSTGAITIANPAAIDFEANPTFVLNVRVSDGSDSSEGLITINLTDTNEPPIVTAGGTLAYTENDPPSIINGSVSIVDEDSPQLTGATVAISANFAAGQDILSFTPIGAITGVFSGNTLTLSGTDTIANYQTALRSVRYQNASDNPSTAPRTITWVVSDGVFTSAPVNSTVNVIAVNDQPTFAIVSDPPASNEDAGPQTVNGFASSITTGGETGQTLTFVLTPTGSTGGLTFSSGPAIDAAGNLTYTASTNANGTATFNVVLTDSGSNTPPNDNTSATLSFTITVNAVNDPPTFTLGPNQSVDEDAGPQTVNGFVTAISVGPANESAQTITAFNVTNDNNALFFQQPAIDASGNLTYQANANAHGTAIVSVTATDSGGATSSPAQTFTITVNSINDEPTFAILADPPASNEDAGLQTVNGFASSISAGPGETGQTLTFTVTPTGTTGDLAFSSGPSIDASGNLTYTAAANTNGTATFNVVLTDSGSNTPPNDNTSATLSFTITVNAVNDPPTFTVGPNQSVAEDAGPQTVNGFVTAISVGPTNESAQTITAFNVTNDNNALFFQQPAIDTAGNLTYQANANAFGSATVSVTATDSGGATSSPAQTFTITIVAQNDNPVVTAGGTLNYTENQAATAIDGTITVSDVDSPMLTGATVTISSNFASGEDVLSFSNIGPITFVSYTGGTLTLAGVDTLANYQAALRTVAYSNTSEDPSTAARTITWQVNDGAGVNNLSVPVTSTVNVTRTNDAPTVAAADALGYTEGNGAVAIDPALTITDPDDTQMSGATVAISANYMAGEDVLSFTPVGSITGIFAAGTLTLSGADSIANYQAALRSVTYNNTSSSPSVAPRTITWTVNDMAPAPGIDTTTITITAVNSAPSLGTTQLTPTIFTEDGAPVQVDATLTVSDADTTQLVSASVTISANYAEGQDFLQFVNTPNITGSFDGPSGTLTLTGTDTVANYQSALRSVTFENISDNPSGAVRTITWQVNDGQPVNSSGTLNTAVDVAPINDPPTVAADDRSYTEDAGAVVIDGSVSVADVDDTNLTGATIVITGACTPGEDVLDFTNNFGITKVSYVAATCTLTLTGSASPASYASALSTVTYQNTSNHPSTALRTITWTVSDDEPSSGSDTSTITVSRLNDPPTALDDAGATNEDTVLNAVAPGVLGNDTDPDGGDTKTVVAVNGVGANVGAPIVTGKGATLTLNANGSYSYDPTGSATLQALATGATDTDTFTYTMQDAAGAQSTATVTITVTGVNDAPTVAADGLLYTENDGAVVIDGSVSVADVDDATLTGATVVITGNCTPGEDVLNFSNAFGVTFVSYTPATCTLVLTGTTSAANYASALSAVTYQNTSEHPSIAQRTITWTVSDDEPSNGIDTSTIDVTRLNDAPVANDDTNSTFEDSPINAVAPGVLANDTDADTSDTKTVVAVNGSGANVGVATTTTQGASVTLNADGSYNYNPSGSATLQALTAGATLDDTFTYTIQDGAASQDTATVTITVTGVNDAPAGTNNTVSLNEDATYTFAAADFGFTDPIDNPDNAFAAVVITTLPGTGSLTLAGNPVVAGQSVPVASIPGLVFTPVANGNGSPYTSFTFQVQDNGGTANGGVDLDPSANTLTINVNNVNDAPAGTDNAVATFEDTQYTFTVANFGFTDPTDTVPNALQSVVITTLPAAGSLTLSGNPVTAGQDVAVADITAGNLRFLAAPNASGTPYTTFTFQVRDDGGTANGGVDLDATPNTMTINVTGVNDAPAGTDTTVTTDEDVQYTFTVADFGFTDPNDTPANVLSSVVITTIPAAGSLTLSGNPVVAGQEIPVASITAGNLKFLSALNAFGSPYTTFTFQVRDDGGTANGGVNLDATPNTLTINVNPVNDGPTVVAETFDVLGNTELRVDMVAGTTPHAAETTAGATAYEGVLDNDSDIEGDPISITGILGCTVADPTPPFDCTLASGAVVHVDANGEFSFTPAPGATTGSFTYTVTDQPSFGTPIAVNGTVTFTHQQMVWYVRQGGTGNGTSIAPFGNFDSLDGAGGGGDVDDADDYIFVHAGSPLALTQTVPLEVNQHVLGEGVGLSIPVNLNGNGSPTNLVAAGARPALSVAAGDLFAVTNAIPVEIRGLTLTSSAGNVVGLDSNGPLTGSASFTISQNGIGGAGAEGIDIAMNAGTTGTLALNITSNDWNAAGTHSGNAIDVVRAAGTLHLDVSNNANIVSNAAAININGGNVANTIVTGFAGNSISGNTGGIGVTVSSVTFDSNIGTAGIQQVDGDNMPVGAPGNPVGGAGVAVLGSQGNLFFDDLDVFSATGTALQISGTGTGLTFAVTPTASGGTSSVDADNGPAIDVSSAAIDLRLSSLQSNTGLGGVSLASTSGQFSAAAGSAISKTSGGGTGFSVASSSVTVDYLGSLNVTAGAGVSLTGNTGTMTFRGGMTLSTGTSAGFTATGGGTIQVCDESPCNGAATGALVNTITTTTGIALNVANTNIGANHLEFRSISSNGATSGIILNNTGTGGLKVKGNSAGNCGGSITLNPVGTAHGVGAPITGDCTGGTIQASTSHGIQLTNTDNVSLTRMHILNSGGDGILFADVNGFTLANSFITDGAGAAGDRGMELGDFSTGTPVNGTITISNSTIGPTPHDNFGVGISSGSSSWSITNSVFTGSTLNSGLNFEIRDATVTNLSITNSVFRSQFADGMQIQPSADANATMSQVTIQNNTFQNNNIGADLNHDGVSNLTYDVLTNTFLGHAAQPINLFSSAVQSPTTGGALIATIEGNRIGDAASFKSGSSIGNGIRVNINGGAGATVLVNSNVVRQTPNGRGLEVISRNGSGGLDITVTNNTVNPDYVATVENGGFSLSAIFLQSNCLTVCNTLRADVRTNTVPAAAPTGELVAGQIAMIETGASTAQLVDSNSSSANATAELTANNTGSCAATAGVSLIPGPISTP